MRNIAARLMFDGSRYHGWQVQKAEVTIAGTIEAALSRLCGHPVKVHGCGRTDAGVHAERYCFNFRTSSSLPPDRLPYAANSLLPPDISVQSAIYAPDDFDANLSCVKKEYTYRIYNSRIRDPFYTNRAYFYPHKLDADAMRRAARHFVGTRDFAAMRSVGTITKTTVRTVYWYEVEGRGADRDLDTGVGDGNGDGAGVGDGDGVGAGVGDGVGVGAEHLISLSVCADGFLYNMARAMAGTLLYVSEGKIQPDDIPIILGSRDRRLAGPTVPPCGLYLSRIWYGGAVGEMFT